MSTATKVRKPRQLSPVSGSVRVLRPLGEVNDTTAEVSINGKGYYLTRLETCFRLTSYDARQQTATTYDLPLTLDSCDCPDATYNAGREGGCKHSRALRALRAAGKL